MELHTDRDQRDHEDGNGAHGDMVWEHLNRWVLVEGEGMEDILGDMD